MDDGLVVTVGDGVKYAPHETGRIPLREVSLVALRLFDNSIEQFPPGAQFGDQVKILLILVYLDEFDDVWMIALPQ